MKIVELVLGERAETLCERTVRQKVDSKLAITAEVHILSDTLLASMNSLYDFGIAAVVMISCRGISGGFASSKLSVIFSWTINLLLNSLRPKQCSSAGLCKRNLSPIESDGTSSRDFRPRFRGSSLMPHKEIP